MMLSGMLWGCAKAEPQVPEEQIPQPPSVSREGWQGYPVAGLTIYLPEMFEEGRIFEDYGEFLSQDEDFEGEYIQLEILSGLEAEWDTPVTDAPALAKDIRTQVEEDEGAVYSTGTYWDVTYLIYSESDSKQDCALVGLYVRDGRGWMVQITGIDLERAAQMVPYVCGGAFATPAGWDAGSDNWMAYSVAGLGIRVPGEMLETYGAVSSQVAQAMAEGARSVLQADVAVSVTGLAGPGGDEYGHPVGTVYIAYEDRQRNGVHHYQFEGDREAVRQQAIEAALKLILLYNE
jgi:hypothetical protein